MLAPPASRRPTPLVARARQLNLPSSRSVAHATSTLLSSLTARRRRSSSNLFHQVSNIRLVRAMCFSHYSTLRGDYVLLFTTITPALNSERRSLLDESGITLTDHSLQPSTSRKLVRFQRSKFVSLLP